MLKPSHARSAMRRGSKLASILLLAAVVARTCPAQERNFTLAEYKPAADRLIAAAMDDTEGYGRLEYLTDHIGKRLSGSESLTRATAWAARSMRDAGLQNVTMQPVMVPHWVRGTESAEMLSPIRKPLHMLGLGMSVGTPAEGITAPVVVVPDFAGLERLGRTGVQGKIVVFNAVYKGYGQTVMYRTAGPSRAAALGAVAVLVRSITPLAMQVPHTGTLRYEADEPKIPAAAISIEDALLLERLSTQGSAPRIHLQMEAHQEPDAPSFNVYGDIPGSEHPEQIVDVGGHIDSWDVGQGAQDDGSGITAALAAADLIHKLGLHPRRTIRVVFWVNEENGGAGGKAYLAGLGESVKNHVAAIEMDGGAEQPVGYGYGASGQRRATPNGPAPKAVLSTEEQQSLYLLQEVASLLKPVGASTVKAGGGGSDISPLMGAGVPGLGEMTTMAHYFDWHHTEADTLDKVDLQDFRKNVASLAVMSYVLADMPARLAGHPGAGEE